MNALDAWPVRPLLDALTQPFKATASGGSTGKPKLIVSSGAFQYPAVSHRRVVDGCR